MFLFNASINWSFELCLGIDGKNSLKKVKSTIILDQKQKFFKKNHYFGTQVIVKKQKKKLLCICLPWIELLDGSR